VESIRQTQDRISRGLSARGLHSLHGRIHHSLAVDDARARPIYGVRQFADFRIQADSIEAELSERGEVFEPIRW